VFSIAVPTSSTCSGVWIGMFVVRGVGDREAARAQASDHRVVVAQGRRSLRIVSRPGPASSASATAARRTRSRLSGVRCSAVYKDEIEALALLAEALRVLRAAPPCCPAGSSC
jgi:hypothetical protein